MILLTIVFFCTTKRYSMEQDEFSYQWGSARWIGEEVEPAEDSLRSQKSSIVSHPLFSFNQLIFYFLHLNWIFTIKILYYKSNSIYCWESIPCYCQQSNISKEHVTIELFQESQSNLSFSFLRMVIIMSTILILFSSICA